MGFFEKGMGEAIIGQNGDGAIFAALTEERWMLTNFAGFALTVVDADIASPMKWPERKLCGCCPTTAETPAERGYSSGARWA